MTENRKDAAQDRYVLFYICRFSITSEQNIIHTGPKAVRAGGKHDLGKKKKLEVNIPACHWL